MANAGAAIAPFFRADVMFALGIVAIILFMLVPMPTSMLDFGLAVSITVSVLVMMNQIMQMVLSFTIMLDFTRNGLLLIYKEMFWDYLNLLNW